MTWMMCLCHNRSLSGNTLPTPTRQSTPILSCAPPNHIHIPHSYIQQTTTPMGEGLTRRRAGGAGGSPTTAQSDQLPSSSNPSSSTTGNKSTPNPNLPPSGSKVAYDPRDFQDDAESNKMPRLTLMEEVLLLGLKDKAVCLYLIFASKLELMNRDTYRSGTTISRMLSEDVS